MKVNCTKTQDRALCLFSKKACPPVHHTKRWACPESITVQNAGNWHVKRPQVVGICRLYLDIVNWLSETLSPVAAKESGVMSDIVIIYMPMIDSMSEYACQVSHTRLTARQSDQLEAIQGKGSQEEMFHQETLQVAGLDTLEQDRHIVQSVFQWQAQTEP